MATALSLPSEHRLHGSEALVLADGVLATIAVVLACGAPVVHAGLFLGLFKEGRFFEIEISCCKFFIEIIEVQGVSCLVVEVRVCCQKL